MITITTLNLEFEHHTGKIDSLTNHCVVMSSGDALLASEVFERMKARLGQPKNLTIQQAAEKLRDSHMSIHLERAEQVILHPYGLTFKEFKEKGAQQILPQSYLNIEQLLFNFGINAVEFVIAGWDVGGTHILHIHYNGIAGGSWLEWCDKLGYLAIGSGSSHALILLSLEGQYAKLGIPETLYNVYCAKKNAELAPGVGDVTDLAIISDSGVEFINSSLVQELDKFRKDTQNSKIDVKKLEGLFAKPTKSD